MTRPPETTIRIDVVWSRAAGHLRPPPLQPLSKFLEANLRLPSGLAAEGGPIRLWPTQRAIADALADPAIERVTLVKSARSGFTTLLTGLVAHHCVNDPAPVLCVLPTEDDARDYMASDVEPIFAASPTLRGVLGEPGRTEAGRNLITHRMFEGGSLKIVASKAPRNLRRHTARILLVDEADACEATAEGDPIGLAEQRTLSFPNRKIIVGSTPIDEETSHVLRLWEQSDQRVFEVPCPACGAFIELRWRHIEFEPLGFRCPHCEALVDESHKLAMVEAGAWRTTRPEVIGHAGFRLNALVSVHANTAWSKLVAKFREVRHDPEQLKVFVNTTLAEGWREQGQETNEGELQARSEPIGLLAAPEAALTLTMGVDVQQDRLECVSTAWDKAGTCYVLAHETLWGPTDANEAWVELDALLKRRFAHPHGGQLRYDAAAVDCGNDFDRVLAFTGPRLTRKVLGVKGVAGMGRPALTPSKSKSGHRRFWVCGVDPIKAGILARLSRPAAFRFSDTLEPIFFEQLVSEKRVVRMSRGRPQIRLELIAGRENHALDALTYAHAARAALRLDLDARERDLSSPSPPPTQTPKVWRSKFVSYGL